MSKLLDDPKTRSRVSRIVPLRMRSRGSKSVTPTRLGEFYRRQKPQEVKYPTKIESTGPPRIEAYEYSEEKVGTGDAEIRGNLDNLKPCRGVG